MGENGGATRTHRVESSSPAIDAGNNTLALVPFLAAALLTDQRGSGFPRSYDFLGVPGSGAGPVDIGAFELAPICVSTTIDELDTDLTYGDLSLREAVNYANSTPGWTSICLPAGTYAFTISGTGAISQGDLEITGNVTIDGDGPGISVIDASGLTADDRIFDVASLGVLNIDGVTLTLGEAPTPTSERSGGAIRVQNGGRLDLDYSAIVGNTSTRSGDCGAIYFAATATGAISNSVITVNEAEDEAGGVYLQSASTRNPSHDVTVTNSIIAKNTGGSATDVYAGTNRSFISGGNNRLGNVTTGFTNQVNGDHVGTAHYIVTSVADTFDGSSDPVSMSVRDAIHQANITAGAQEIWLPAWAFTLDRDRDTYGSGTTDTDVAFGDLDIKDSLTIRGIAGTTNVAWRSGIVDDVFDLLGDYNDDLHPDYNNVSSGDYTIWLETYNSGVYNPDADGNDDGVVNEADYDVWHDHFNNSLTLENVVV